ncbi:hypothetical protein NQ317_011038 [Molorchus minor]|uniref:DUF4817 domain-containing protein n=1 Tax=Molorchus minor TaxID=1323400 RepID=A0ABQ9JAR3_9CUCU|nr:hypothetical protein NQ317_011038 [Molorchus minor]
MIFMYGEAGRNIENARQLYAERFPHRRQPSTRSFYRVVHQFSEDGSIQPRKRQRRRTVTGEVNEIAVLATVNMTPHTSSRALSFDLGISQTSILRILKRHKFHPFHVSLHQELHGDETFTLESHFVNGHVLFSDESSFTSYGEVNRHNMHYWSSENPRWLREVEMQRRWTRQLMFPSVT